MSEGLHVTGVFFMHACNWTVSCMYWTDVSGVGSTGAMGANATIHLSEAPVRLHYTCPIHCTQIQSVLHWEGFKDSSISADSGHDRVGMMGGGVQISCPRQWFSFLLAVLTKLYYSVHIIITCWWCSCIYTSPEASSLLYQLSACIPMGK